jgi:endonuclease/exonuclease/phosphatase (EEP) superfamily protein YafD
MVVHRGRLCRADACGAATYFGRAKGLGAAKRLRFKNKKAKVLDLEFVFEKGKK